MSGAGASPSSDFRNFTVTSRARGSDLRRDKISFAFAKDLEALLRKDPEDMSKTYREMHLTVLKSFTQSGDTTETRAGSYAKVPPKKGSVANLYKSVKTLAEKGLPQPWFPNLAAFIQTNDIGGDKPPSDRIVTNGMLRAMTDVSNSAKAQNLSGLKLLNLLENGFPTPDGKRLGISGAEIVLTQEERNEARLLRTASKEDFDKIFESTPPSFKQPHRHDDLDQVQEQLEFGERTPAKSVLPDDDSGESESKGGPPPEQETLPEPIVPSSENKKEIPLISVRGVVEQPPENAALEHLLDEEEKRVQSLQDRLSILRRRSVAVNDGIYNMVATDLSEEAQDAIEAYQKSEGDESLLANHVDEINAFLRRVQRTFGTELALNIPAHQSEVPSGFAGGSASSSSKSSGILGVRSSQGLMKQVESDLGQLERLLTENSAAESAFAEALQNIVTQDSDPVDAERLRGFLDWKVLMNSNNLDDSSRIISYWNGTKAMFQYLPPTLVLGGNSAGQVGTGPPPDYDSLFGPPPPVVIPDPHRPDEPAAADGDAPEAAPSQVDPSGGPPPPPAPSAPADQSRRRPRGRRNPSTLPRNSDEIDLVTNDDIREGIRSGLNDNRSAFLSVALGIAERVGQRQRDIDVLDSARTGQPLDQRRNLRDFDGQNPFQGGLATEASRSLRRVFVPKGAEEEKKDAAEDSLPQILFNEALRTVKPSYVPDTLWTRFSNELQVIAKGVAIAAAAAKTSIAAQIATTATATGLSQGAVLALGVGATAAAVTATAVAGTMIVRKIQSVRAARAGGGDGGDGGDEEFEQEEEKEGEAPAEVDEGGEESKDTEEITGPTGRFSILSEEEKEGLTRREFALLNLVADRFVTAADRGNIGYGSRVSVPAADIWGRAPKRAKVDNDPTSSTFTRSDMNRPPFEGTVTVQKDPDEGSSTETESKDPEETNMKDVRKPYMKFEGQILWIPIHTKAAHYYFQSEDYKSLVDNVSDEGGTLTLKGVDGMDAAAAQETVKKVKLFLGVFGMLTSSVSVANVLEEWLELRQIVRAIRRYEAETVGEYQNQSGIMGGNIRTAVQSAIGDVLKGMGIGEDDLKTSENRVQGQTRGLEGGGGGTTTMSLNPFKASPQPTDVLMWSAPMF